MSVEPFGLITLALFVVYAVGGRAFAMRRVGNERRALDAVGERLGIRERVGGSEEFEAGWTILTRDREVRKLRGEVDGVPITVGCFRPDDLTARERVTRYAAGGVTRTVVIRARGGLAALGETLAGRAARTGDDGFDAEVTCDGDELMLVAALDAEARARLIGLFGAERDARVQDGEVRVDQVGVPDTPDRAEALVRRLVAVAAAMPAEGVGIRARVERIVTGDPVPAVRARALAVLHRRLPGAETEAFLRRMLTVACVEVRATAARVLGDAPTLEALALDPTLTWPERVDCIERLAAIGDGIGGAGIDGDGIDGDGIDGARRVRLVSLEAGLVGALGDPDALVREAAARALGHIGTVSAVEPLRARAREGLGLGRVAVEAEAAIRIIHVRENADGGRLALAGEGGEVAIAGEGGVALANGPEDAAPGGAPTRIPLPKAVRAG